MHNQTHESTYKPTESTMGFPTLAPQPLTIHLLVENVSASRWSNFGGEEANAQSKPSSYLGRGLTFLLISLLFMTGCSGSQTNSAPNETPGTIFGQLSQLVQLGSTEETLTYKLQVGEFFVTMRGEVLLNRPVYIDTIVTERKSGAVRDDVVVTLDLCHAVDEDIFRVGSCTEFDGPLYEHQLTPTFQGGLYHADGFEWQRSDNWTGTLTITTPESGESETVDIGFYVYPARPPSTNLFELISISLPFVVIGLFLLGILRMGGLSVLQRAT